MCGSEVYKKDTKRVKKPNVPFGKSKEGHTEFVLLKSFIINSYYTAIDELKQNLAIKKAAYSDINDHFGFL